MMRFSQENENFSGACPGPYCSRSDGVLPYALAALIALLDKRHLALFQYSDGFAHHFCISHNERLHSLASPLTMTSSFPSSLIIFYRTNPSRNLELQQLQSGLFNSCKSPW